jgi:predicted NUDIX family NTP pyrophosphohydrolase
MANQSAGILLFRFRDRQLEFFLVHPGGPYWRNKDAAAWTIPKGEFGEDEAPLAAAQREFAEETGVELNGDFLELTQIRQKGGKLVYAFALEAEFDPAQVKSNTFEMEWPPRSGKRVEFPEVDQAAWFRLDEAQEKINSAQAALLHELAGRLA